MVLWKYNNYQDFVILENDSYEYIEDVIERELLKSKDISVSQTVCYTKIPLLEIYSYFYPEVQKLIITKINNQEFHITLESSFNSLDMTYYPISNVLYYCSENNCNYFLKLWRCTPRLINLANISFTVV